MVVPPLMWLGDPFFPLLRGLAAADPHLLGRPAPAIASRPSILHVVDPSQGRAASASLPPAWGWHRAGGLRVGLALDRLALPATRLLPRGRGCCSGIPSSALIPAGPRWSLWLLFPYLILADVQNTVLSALLTFSDRLLYPYYAEVPRIGGLSALEDQSAAGVIMWVPGSLVYLVPLFVIGVRLLMDGERKTPRRAMPRRSLLTHIPLPARVLLPILGQPQRIKCGPSPFDALRIPGLGRFLRWRHARITLQIPSDAGSRRHRL